MKFRDLTLGVALLAALPAYAHEAKSLHGGRLADAGPYHVELVAKEKAIDVFIVGEGRYNFNSQFAAGALLSIGDDSTQVGLYGRYNF